MAACDASLAPQLGTPFPISKIATNRKDRRHHCD